MNVPKTKQSAVALTAILTVRTKIMAMTANVLTNLKLILIQTENAKVFQFGFSFYGGSSVR